MDGQRSEHVGKLSWRMTALNRCTVTESLWKRKAVCRSSLVLTKISVIISIIISIISVINIIIINEFV